MTADPSPGHFIGPPSLNVGHLRQFAWFLSRGKTDTPKVGAHRNVRWIQRACSAPYLLGRACR